MRGMHHRLLCLPCSSRRAEALSRALSAFPLQFSGIRRGMTQICTWNTCTDTRVHFIWSILEMDNGVRNAKLVCYSSGFGLAGEPKRWAPTEHCTLTRASPVCSWKPHRKSESDRCAGIHHVVGAKWCGWMMMMMMANQT